MKKLTIWFDDEHDKVETLKEVTRLVEEGYCVGYYPRFEFEKE